VKHSGEFQPGEPGPPEQGARSRLWQDRWAVTGAGIEKTSAPGGPPRGRPIRSVGKNGPRNLELKPWGGPSAGKSPPTG